METPEETNYSMAVTMATDSDSNALHRPSAHADRIRGYGGLADSVHSTKLRHSGSTWAFVEFV